MADIKNEPNNIEAEMQALGCGYVSKIALEKICEELTGEMFYDKKHEIIFNAMYELNLRNEVIDATILKNEIEKKHPLREIGGIEYLTEIITCATSASRIDAYITIIREKALRRNLISTCERIERDSRDEKIETNELVDNAEKQVFAVSKNRKTSEFKTSENVVRSSKEMLETRSKNGKDVTGLSTGFVKLDKLTTGLHPSELIILAARPAMGKTAFALNLAYNAAVSSKKNVAIFNMEMSAEQLMDRIVSSVAAVPGNKIRTGRLDHNDWKKINIAYSEIQSQPLYFEDTPGITVGEIRAKCRRLASIGNGLGLVVIDHMQLIDAGSGYGANEVAAMTDISRGLKRMAIELGVPVIGLSQLSRSVESRENKRPIMSDLRQSGSIEQDADIVALLYREDYYNKTDGDNPNSISELIVGKNRSGSTDTIKLLFQRDISLFSNYIETQNNE